MNMRAIDKAARRDRKRNKSRKPAKKKRKARVAWMVVRPGSREYYGVFFTEKEAQDFRRAELYRHDELVKTREVVR